MGWSVPGYTAERMLGVGATGEVWAGRDVRTGERVALKRLRLGAQPEDREMLRREAAVLAAFRHPAVVPLHGVLATAEGLVLVLALAEGGSLAGLLAARGSLPPDDAIDVCQPIARALAAAHAEGFVHGDVSLGNVLLDSRGRPLLADLGTARLIGEPAGEVRGTTGYVDPAVIDGEAPSPATDVYGLAAVLVHLVTGEVVAGVEASLRRSREAGAPDALVDLLRRCLAAAPAGRPTATTFADALERLSSGPVVEPFEITRRIAAPPVAPVEPGVWARLVARIQGRRRNSTTPEGQDHGRHRGRPSLRRRLAWGAVMLVGAIMCGSGVSAAWASLQQPKAGLSTSAPPSPVAAQTPRPSRSAPDLRAMLSHLDGVRAQAFAAADPVLLQSVYAADSGVLRADASSIEELRRCGCHAIGVVHDIVSVQVVRSEATRIEVRVTDRLRGYRVVDRQGRAVLTIAARGDRTVTMVLVRSPEWRISVVS